MALRTSKQSQGYATLTTGNWLATQDTYLDTIVDSTPLRGGISGYRPVTTKRPCLQLTCWYASGDQVFAYCQYSLSSQLHCCRRAGHTIRMRLQLDASARVADQLACQIIKNVTSQWRQCGATRRELQAIHWAVNQLHSRWLRLLILRLLLWQRLRYWLRQLLRQLLRCLGVCIRCRRLPHLRLLWLLW